MQASAEYEITLYTAVVGRCKLEGGYLSGSSAHDSSSAQEALGVRHRRWTATEFSWPIGVRFERAEGRRCREFGAAHWQPAFFAA